MRLVPSLALVWLVGCGGARARLEEPGCRIGSSHVGQSCGGTPVHADAHDRDADGIHDDDDLCPGTPGHGTTNGCPAHEPD
jgi:hypothetical protein